MSTGAPQPCAAAPVIDVDGTERPSAPSAIANAPAPIEGPDIAKLLEWRNAVRPLARFDLTTISTKARIGRKAGKLRRREFPATQKGDDDLRVFVEAAHRNEDNVYWQPAIVRAGTYIKASKDDVISVARLWVDIDYRAGEPHDAEKRRILALADEKLPANVPPPTLVEFTGGGAQFVWDLDADVLINGEATAYEALERHGLWLEHTFEGSDNCRNVDRILRCPYTWNFASAKKIAKGRKKAFAYIVEYHPERIYSLSRFPQATTEQALEGSRGGPGSAKISSDGTTVPIPDGSRTIKKWVADQGGTIEDWALTLIEYGHDPKQPGRYIDNSKTTATVANALVEANLSEVEIRSVLLDPDLGISKHCLGEKNSLRAANRAIAYAQKHVAEQKTDAEKKDQKRIDKLNKLYAVILLAGKPMILHKLTGELSTMSDFVVLLENRLVPVGKTFVSEGLWFRRHRDRDYYPDGFVIDSTRDYGGERINGVCPKSFNIWRGWGCKAVEGDCKRALDFIRNVICDRNVEYFNWLIYWCARMYQRPEELAHIGIVLIGAQGTGKNFFVDMLASLMHRDHWYISGDAKEVLGDWTRLALHGRKLLALDEAVPARNPEQTAKCKRLIDAPTIIINAKFQPAFEMVNILALIFMTNHDHAIMAEDGDRRSLVLRVSSAHRKDTEYFGGLQKWLDEGGREHLLHYFLHVVDISDFNYRLRPETTELQRQKEFSLSPAESWVFALAMDGQLPVIDMTTALGRAGALPQALLLAEGQEYDSLMNLVTMGRLLSKFGAKKPGNSRLKKGWIMPSLRALRDIWEERGMSPKVEGILWGDKRDREKQLWVYLDENGPDLSEDDNQLPLASSDSERAF